jgi:hypothetical protein
MAAVDVVKVPTALSFAVIVALLTVSVLVARARAKRLAARDASTLPPAPPAT